MAYFRNKTKYIPQPIPPTPPYTPPTPPTPPTTESGSVPSIPRYTFTGNVTCNLYVNNSDTNVLNKSLTLKKSDNISIKEDTSIVTPSILINSDVDLSGINYMKLDNYYYYASVTLLNGNLYRIDGKMDGLMSADYSNCKGLLNRSACKYNEYQANDIPIASYEQIKTLSFSNGFSKELKYLLVTVGGATNE